MSVELWKSQFSRPANPVALAQDGEAVSLHVNGHVETFDASSAIALGELLVEAGRRASQADAEPGNWQRFYPDARVITIEHITPIESFYAYFTVEGLVDWAAETTGDRREGLRLAALALVEDAPFPLPDGFPAGYLSCSSRRELERQLLKALAEPRR